MKQFFLFLSISLFFVGCKSYKAYLNQEFEEVIETPFKFKLDNNKILCTVNDNSSSYELLFDTGCSMTTFFDEKVLKDFKSFGEKKVDLAYKKGQVIVKKGILDLDYKFLKIKNNLVAYQSVELKDSGCFESNLEGIIGMDIFTFLDSDTSKYILDLKFSDSTIILYDTLPRLKKLGSYINLSSKFYLSQHPMIYLKIEGYKDSIKFLFDTGFDYSMIINDEEVYEKINKDSLVRMNELKKIASKSGYKEKLLNSDMFISDVSLLNGENLKTPVIFSEDFSKNILGLQFIKQYDWVIDFINKEVYFKKHEVISDNQNLHALFYNMSYFVAKEKNKIYINKVNEKFTKYKLGAIIKSVNGTLVTEENICEMESLVNSKPDEVVLEFEENFIEEAK
jgi:predicted aspartyl protease